MVDYWKGALRGSSLLSESGSILDDNVQELFDLFDSYDQAKGNARKQKRIDLLEACRGQVALLMALSAFQGTNAQRVLNLMLSKFDDEESAVYEGKSVFENASAPPIARGWTKGYAKQGQQGPAAASHRRAAQPKGKAQPKVGARRKPNNASLLRGLLG
jgi:hypothetical protein